MSKPPALKRTLTLPLVALYGLGNILGAGIYVLVGKVAGAAGSGAGLSFLIAMVVAAFTAFAYMELAVRYPVSAGVSVYLHRAFKLRWLSVTIGLVLVAGGITSAAALAHGFGGYAAALAPVPVLAAALAIIAVFTAIALRGIGESATAAGVFTLVEVGGLAAIIWAGRGAIFSPAAAGAFTLDPGLGLSGVLAGAFLAFYAFIGFEDMVNVVEEVHRPKLTMPAAIAIALAGATVMYLLVIIVCVATVPPAELAASNAPLSLVFHRLTGASPTLISLIGLAATANGILVQLIMGSRVLYGLAAQGWLPAWLTRVNRSQIPVTATLIVAGLMLTGVIMLPLISLAQLTSLLVLGVFTLVNASLIKIKLSTRPSRSDLRVPIAVPVIGLITCAAVIIYQFT